MDIVRDGQLVTLTPQEETAFTAALPPPPAEPPRLIAKTTIYRRATDTELAELEGFMASQVSPRQRLMWQDAEGGMVYVSDVQPLAEALFGAVRAAELLAPADPPAG